MDELLRIRILRAVGSTLGIVGILFLFLGSGYDKYTGYSEKTGVPYAGWFGFAMIVIGGIMLKFASRKSRRNK